MDLAVERIEWIPVEVLFREVPARNMARELPHWKYFEIVEVELASGYTGFGETMLYYSWGETTDADAERARGENAVDLLWEDSLGPGLQIALFDAVGRATGAPVHSLLGGKVHDRTPVSWWCIDMPPEDWVSEAETAIENGYTSLKVKGRPWYDLREQIERLNAELPPWFDVDVDFNATALDADRAFPLLEELQSSPLVSHFEEPIPQEDLEGNRRLAESLDVPIVHHYGRTTLHDGPPAPVERVRKGACDGFVATGGASRLRNTAAVADALGTPFWLQLVGTGITAAFSVHCGGAFERATWPAINCHQLFEHDLLVDPIEVEDGGVSVPDEPGLGYRLDRDALERFRIEKPDSQPSPDRLIEVDWDDGSTIYFAGNDDQLLYYAMDDGNVPYFERDVSTRVVPDDGSDRWSSMHEAAVAEPVVEDRPAFD